MKVHEGLVQITPVDSVAVAVTPLTAGKRIERDGEVMVIGADIPAGHKVALHNIARGELVIKYGNPIGEATSDIGRGNHVHVHNMRTLLCEKTEYRYSPDLSSGQAAPAASPSNDDQVPSILAYRRADGAIGIRNEIWVVPTVGCVNQTAESLAAWANRNLVGRSGDSAVDGAFAWRHPYGCSQMGDDHRTTRKILADLVRHPNAAAVLVIGLGCENNTIEEFKKELGPYDEERVRFLVTQQVADEIAEGRALLEDLYVHAERFSREQVPISELVIGLKCGGSDGLSGITANPLVGRICDRITDLGGTAILTEVPEMFGAEQLLMNRCATRELFDQTVVLINDFKEYYTSHNQVVYENPSPGNKDGGITTLEDKSLGCIQKGGRAVIHGVLKYGELVKARGLQLLEGPGNDIVSTTALTAAGAHLILFTTGRGTPLGAPVPTLKIASNSAMAGQKKGWIDFDAGRLLAEDMADVADELMTMICEIASGVRKTRNEENGYREIALFKSGVTL